MGEEVEALEMDCEDLRVAVSRELQLPETLAAKLTLIGHRKDPPLTCALNSQ